MQFCRLLFLLGGSAAFDAAAEVFVPAAGGRDARIALLLQGGENWKKYVPQYVQSWERKGASQYDLIAPEEGGTLDVEKTSAILREATGIFIGGGHTPTYHRLYATELIRSIIRERYQAGVPVAGVSAGALIALNVCQLTPDETSEDALRVVAGLGLIGDLVIGVHFTELNALPEMLETMAQTQTRTGVGIDETACAVFEDDEFRGVLGRSIYEVEMTDFEHTVYRITERTDAYSARGASND
jgi:cyanophycinase